MAYSPILDGQAMKQVRPTINSTGNTLQTAIKTGFEHTQGDWNAGALTEQRLVSPENIRLASQNMSFQNLAFPVAWAVLSMQSSGSPVIATNYGFSNIFFSSVGTDHIQFDFQRTMANSSYCVIPSYHTDSFTDGGGNAFTWNQSISNFHLTLLARGGVPATSGIDRASVMVFGEVA